MKKISKPGLYLLFNSNRELVYIGKGINMYQRVFNSINEKIRKDITYFSLLKQDLTYADCCVYEIYLINKYKPLLNKESKSFDSLSLELPEIKFSKLYFISTEKANWCSNFDKENIYNKGGRLINYADFKFTVKPKEIKSDNQEKGLIKLNTNAGIWSDFKN